MPPQMLMADQVNHVFQELCETVCPKKDYNPIQLAKLESFISQGLTFKFDGKEDNLPPWVDKFRSFCTYTLWQEVTYITVAGKLLDIFTNFTLIVEAKICSQAQYCSTPENQINILKLDHPELYYSRLLGNVVMRSISKEFHTTLQNYAGRDLCSHGFCAH
jgi:hypothetical protein